ncbi:MAG: hypothetical protein ACI83B_001968, partial [Sediminicola sp.]
KSFKKAIGTLYRDKQIILKDGGIELLGEETNEGGTEEVSE